LRQKLNRKTKTINFEKLEFDLKLAFESIEEKPPSVENLNALTESYYSICRKVLDKHAPELDGHVRIRKPNPWSKEDIKHFKNEKRQAERKWRKSRKNIDYEVYKEKRNLLNRQLQNLKATHLKDKISQNKGNSKALFKIINSCLNRKQECPLPQHDNKETLANDFCSFFDEKIASIRERLANNSDPSNATEYTASTPYNGRKLIKFSTLSPEEMKKLIKEMATKHCILDPIHTWIIKRCLNAFLPILTKIVNMSLLIGSVPDKTKHAIIRPLQKKSGSDLSFKNYRPVSNLAFIGKLIESAVIQQFNNHLKTNSLEDDRQSAYKPHHSTETLLTKIHNDILQDMSKGKIVMLVLLDLSAAFDTIDHDILLNRLAKTYGINGTPLKWFKSYLLGRTQSVIIGDKESKHIPLKQGVPQGSKLGPILFNSYIAPMSNIARNHDITDEKYADDEQLILSFRPGQESEQANAIRKLEKCIGEISDFLKNNKLCNNCDKTEFLLLGNHTQISKVTKTELTVGNSIISPVSDVRNLGVIFDQNMTMEKQINKMCRNAYFNIKNISKLRKNLDEDNLKTLTNALVTPHLDYGNGLLYEVSKKQERKLQVAQNSAARLIKNIGKYDSITKHRKNMHWLPIPARIQYKILCLAWKTINNQAPKYLANIIKLRNNTRNLRNNILLEIPNNYNQNNLSNRSFSRSAPKLWNALPMEIKCQNTLDSFKRKLKTHLFRLSYD
jgi:hypothetical protein